MATKVHALAAKAERPAVAVTAHSSHEKGTNTSIKTLTDLVKSLVKAMEDQKRTHQNQIKALTEMHENQIETLTRKDDSDKVVQKHGEIRVYHARMQIQGEEEDEKEVVNMRLKGKEKVWRKNYLKVLKQLKESFSEII